MYLAIWTLIYADRLDEAERYFDQAQANARRRGWEGEFANVVGQPRPGPDQAGTIRRGRGRRTRRASHRRRRKDRARAIMLSCLLQTMVERADPATWQPFLAEHGLEGDLTDRPMGGLLLYSRGHMRLAAGKPARGAHRFSSSCNGATSCPGSTPRRSRHERPRRSPTYSWANTTPRERTPPMSFRGRGAGTALAHSRTRCARQGSLPAATAGSSCCASRRRRSRAHPPLSSSRSLTEWAPRYAAPEIAARRVNRCAKRSTSLTDAAPRHGPTAREELSRAARGPARLPAAALTR